jgi:hypothetical protein
LPEVTRETVVMTVIVGGEESEYDLSGEDMGERVFEIMSQFTRSRERKINVCVERIKRRGVGNGC